MTPYLDGPVPLLVPAALLVLAVPLLWLAARGRRTDDHPLCRKCGFDLFGKPADATRCSECGADLRRRRAVRVGNRQRRHRLAYMSFIGVAAGAGWLGVGGWRAAQHVDWNRHKPLWWVKKDLDAPPGPARDAALRELGKRVAEQKLPDAEVAALIDRALAYQADVTKPWSPAWGEVVEAARWAGRCPAERWKRYLTHSVTFSIEVLGQENRTGEPVVVRLLRGPDRVGTKSFELQIEADPRKVSVGGRTDAYDDAANRYSAGGEVPVLVPAGPTNPVGAAVERGIYRTASLSPGPHAVRWPVTLRAPAQVDGVVASLAVALFADNKFGARSTDVAGTFTLLAADAPAADGGPPGAALDRWLGRVTVDSVRYDNGSGELTVELNAPGPPRGARVSVALRPNGGGSGSGGSEIPVGTAFFDPGGVDGQVFEASVERLDASTVDVVLRLVTDDGATDEGATTKAATADAGEPVVIKGVAVKRDR